MQQSKQTNENAHIVLCMLRTGDFQIPLQDLNCISCYVTVSVVSVLCHCQCYVSITVRSLSLLLDCLCRVTCQQMNYDCHCHVTFTAM